MMFQKKSNQHEKQNQQNQQSQQNLQTQQVQQQQQADTSAQESKYTKSQLLTSQTFSPMDKDIMAVILADELTYSKSEVQEAIHHFKLRGVK